MREHGTRACYVHGPEPGSKPGGCRCDACRKAATEWQAAQRARFAPVLVGADRVRQHLRDLADAGVGLKTVAKRSGVAHGALYKIVYGTPSIGRGPSKRVRPETAEKILAVSPRDAAPRAYIDGTSTLRNVEVLVARGWTKAAIGRRLGQTGPGLQLARNGRVTKANADKVAALLDEPVPPRNLGRAGVVESTWDPEAERLAEARHAAKVEARQVDDLPTLDPAMFDAEWRRRAACRLVPADQRWIFWPGRGDHRALAAAKRVCASCPVADQCLDVALSAGEPGVWGGTSEVERERLAGKRRSA